MGIRLYPENREPSVLEKLIDVPEGTYDRLKQFETAFNRTFDLDEYYQQTTYVKDSDSEDLDVEYMLWKLINSDQNLAKLKSFLGSGWGKFQLRQEDDCVGEIKPGADALHMLISTSNGEYFSSHMSPQETMELAEGFYWL